MPSRVPSPRHRRGCVALLLLATSLLAVAPRAAAAQEASSARITAAEHAERRAALAAEVGSGVILAPGSVEPAHDYLPFHQNSDFRYLTGFTGTNAMLVMEVEDGEPVREVLFVNPRDPARETWEGIRPDPGEIERMTGLPGRSLAEMDGAIDELLLTNPPVFLVGPYQPDAPILDEITQRFERILTRHPGVTATPVTDRVRRLREVKSDAEIERLRQSIDITAEAHSAMMSAMAPGRNEFEIQALVEYVFRSSGAERPAFVSIVGSGPNSTILHYNENDRFMEDGDIVVVDIGASWGGYAADVTRTVPVSGRFSEPQREIYGLVLEAQEAAEAVAGPGVHRDEMTRAATGVLAAGLADLGLIEGPDAWYEDEAGRRMPQLLLYFMHGLAHGIGLDVHDPWPAVLEPGVAFTIEPGVYVRENLFDEIVPDTEHNRRMIEAIRPAFDRYVNIGVRIEDDYLVTTEGLERLSRAPRGIEEVEAAMAREFTGLPERRSDWVERYREVGGR